MADDSDVEDGVKAAEPKKSRKMKKRKMENDENMNTVAKEEAKTKV